MTGNRRALLLQLTDQSTSTMMSLVACLFNKTANYGFIISLLLRLHLVLWALQSLQYWLL